MENQEARYLLYKSPEKWTESQQLRATILFNEYPEIKQAYDLSTQLRTIFNMRTEKGIALTKLKTQILKALQQ